LKSEYESRPLKRREIRERALNKVIEYLDIKGYTDNAEQLINKPKVVLKEEYLSYKQSMGQTLSGAESSVINEIYNQIENYE
ncbi:MAG: hypothetical protein K2J74_01995, partial [Muribaculaceae bacterium]|nr:hypothetical protein [Muribaculaceae bacterium]